MRVLLFALLLINAVFFGWSQWLAAPAASSAPAVKLNLPTLQLASVPDAATVRCRSLGPFDDAASAQRAADALHQRGVQAQEREVDATVSDGFWVHVDLADETAQHRAFARLVAAGIHDAALLTQGEDAGRISVGVFSDQTHAVHRAEEVRALGFKPVLEVHQRMGHQQWLDMYLPRDRPEPSLADLGSGSGAAGSDAQPAQFVDCPGTRSGVT